MKTKVVKGSPNITRPGIYPKAKEEAKKILKKGRSYYSESEFPYSPSSVSSFRAAVALIDTNNELKVSERRKGSVVKIYALHKSSINK
mgnify:CR=1 FL=1